MEKEAIDQFILEATGAENLKRLGVVQTLWSGYGSIVRIALEGTKFSSVIVKHVQPENGKHPRGWNTDLSHRRKLKSYEVETNWYRDQSNGEINQYARIPKCFGVKNSGSECLIVMEDLDASGYGERRSSVNLTEMHSCVRWLAGFHAYYMNRSSEGLWDTGTYWHLETRPDELDQLDDPELKAIAPAIDEKLKRSTFQTLVHGDAKLANFCFPQEGLGVAAVDFQYVGGGCGMKDLAYFVGSCFRDQEAEEKEEEILDFYFQELSKVIVSLGSSKSTADIEENWRPLYRVAWADFHRFMKGWSPGHWKLSDYSERVTREVMDTLKEVEV
tara:strand:- start:1416 stop:2405 length:990 start_codon:yes stop_codon:yes gene_type:complete